MLPFLKSSNKTLYLLVLLYLFAVFLRTIYLDKHLFFSFEQGRDFIAAGEISKFNDAVLVGPKTDIPGVFHGAYYYYVLALIMQLTNGNPVAVSYILVLISSLGVIPLFYLGKEVFQNRFGGTILSIFFVVSFHYISYARWLSNVSPAVPLGAAAYFFIYKYAIRKKITDLYLFTFCAFFAAQFEIILSLWFVFFLTILVLQKAIVFPTIKNILGLSTVATFLYLPFLVFNIRNQWITLSSIRNYLSEGSSTGLNLVNGLKQYAFLQIEQFQTHIIGFSFIFSCIFLLIVTVYLVFIYKKMNTREQVFLKISYAWILMTLPVLLFPKSLSLVQLYIETGFGIIGLFTLTILNLNKEKYGKFILVTFVVLLTFNLYKSTSYLVNNQKVFFVTIQDGHNLREQKELLNFIHEDSKSQPYHFKAYTIPYYQEEGWQYLHQYYLDDKTGIEYKTIYLIIEKPVDPMWHERWVGEFGPNILDSTYNFGYFTLEKRLKTTQEK